jgi:hypothetical protein
MDPLTRPLATRTMQVGCAYDFRAPAAVCIEPGHDGWVDGSPHPSPEARHLA